MKKKLTIWIVLLLCVSLAACGGPDSDSTPGKISDVIPYNNDEAVFYSFIETVGGRSVTLAYPEDREAEMVELLESIDLKSLPVNGDLEAAQNLTGLYLSLLVESGDDQYFITAAGLENVYLTLSQGAEITHSYVLDMNSELLRQFTEIDRKVHEYSHDGTGFMEVSKDGVDVQYMDKGDSLYLADIMDAALEEGTSAENGGKLDAEDFAVKMELDGQVWYLDPESRMAGKQVGETIAAVKMEDMYFLPVMRKLAGRLFMEERIAAEVKASWDAAKLADQLGKKTPYTKLYRYCQVALGQWQGEEKALKAAETAWIQGAAMEWYASREGIMPEQQTLDKQVEGTASAYGYNEWYQKACEKLGITVEEWVTADRDVVDDSMILTAVYTSSGITAEELNDLVKSINTEFLESEAYENIRPQFERSLQLLESGKELTAEQLMEEDIFIE